MFDIILKSREGKDYKLIGCDITPAATYYLFKNPDTNLIERFKDSPEIREKLRDLKRVKMTSKQFRLKTKS